MTYSEKLADPRWQKKRLEIFNRDNWTCQHCGSKIVQLEIHHVEYFDGKQPWEYDNGSLLTVCHDCHGVETVRFKHENYLLSALKVSGFLAVDILALSCLISTDTRIRERLKNMVRVHSNEQ